MVYLKIYVYTNVCTNYPRISRTCINPQLRKNPSRAFLRPRGCFLARQKTAVYTRQHRAVCDVISVMTGDDIPGIFFPPLVQRARFR